MVTTMHVKRSRRAGVRAVVNAAAAAVDDLITARVGIPPFRWCARRAGRALAEAIRGVYWRGRYGPLSEETAVELHIVDAEIIEEAE
jgi:hypothetical protein